MLAPVTGIIVGLFWPNYDLNARSLTAPAQFNFLIATGLGYTFQRDWVPYKFAALVETRFKVVRIS